MAQPPAPVPSACVPRATTPLAWAVVWTAFLVYGSLMPWVWKDAAPPGLWGFLGLLVEPAAWPTPSGPDLATNLCLYVPLGFALAAMRPSSPIQVVVTASALSLLIECAQLFVPMRSSSPWDWVTNTLGAAVGVMAWTASEASRVRVRRWIESLPPQAWQRFGTRGQLALLVLGLPYLLLQARLHHWHEARWHDLALASANVTGTVWLPFFYHQKAATVVALTSVMVRLVVDMPVGVAIRAWLGEHRAGVRWSVFTGLLVGTLAQVGQLLVEGQHLDTGDLLIAGAGAAVGYRLSPWLLGIWHRGLGTATAARRSPRSAQGVHATAWASRVWAAACVVLALAAWADFPVHQGLVGLVMAACLLTVWRWPQAWMVWSPAILMALDLAPWSGRLFLDEVDITFLAISAGLLLQPSVRHPAGGGVERLLWAVMGLSVIAGLAMGLDGRLSMEGLRWASELSPEVAWRVAKGFGWALLLLALSRRAGLDPQAVARAWPVGLVAGLCSLTGLALWERVVYPGLGNLDSEHRVGAFVSSMHNGGSHIEALLILALPFLPVLALRARSMAWRALASLLGVAALYVLFVTYARGGYLALIMVLGVLAVSVARHWSLQPKSLRGVTVGGLSAVLVLAMGAWVLTGSFAQQRMAQWRTDLDVRVHHWRQVLDLRDGRAMSAWFGMGLGSFPRQYLFQSAPGEAPGSFALKRSNDAVLLELGSGKATYVEQIVEIRPGQVYRLELDFTAPGPRATLNVLLCARTYFIAYGCSSATFNGTEDARRQQRVAQVDAGFLAQGVPWMRRQVKLSLENAGASTTVSIHRVRLLDGDGIDLIRNGAFERGWDHWFTSANFSHLAWHAKNLGVGLLFDQGWFGVIAFASILAAALGSSGRLAWRGDLTQGAALAAMLGFLVVGCFDSLLDAPRVATLFFLLLGLGTAAAWTGTGKPEQLTGAPAPTPRPQAPGPPADGVGQRALSPQPVGRLTPYAGLMVAVIALAIGFAAIGSLPGVPYNLRAVLNPWHPVAGALALALAVAWIGASPAWVAWMLCRGRGWEWTLPGLAAVHGLISWALVRQGSVPLMVHKLTGAPQLQWPWDLETAFRFAALDCVVFVPLVLAALAPRIRAGEADVRVGAVATALGALTLTGAHWVMVPFAVTDNLVELLADGGAMPLWWALPMWVLVLGTSGVLIFHRRRLAAVVPLSLLGGYGCLWLATEQHVSKYDASFSALQFLLSSDRAHYAGLFELAWRYGVAHLVALGLLVLLQSSGLRACAPRRATRDDRMKSEAGRFRR